MISNPAGGARILMNEYDELMRFEGIDDAPIANIDITNDFMFAYVMSKSDVCIELLKCLLPDRNIRSIRYLSADESGDEVVPETQKTLLANADMRSVRLDAYLDDGETVYNIEIQAASNPYLAKRARLYQAHMDVSQLKRGQNFDQLRPNFVIFICKFDPFGQGLYRYSFENVCHESEGLKLNDEAYKLFFNTSGTKGDISEKQKELLKYMNDSNAYPIEATDNDLIRLIDRRVEESLKNVEWRNAYMTFQMKQRDAELRGIKIGQQRGIEIGRQSGIEIGRQSGKLELSMQIARNMAAAGMTIDTISELMGLSVAEVKSLIASDETLV